MALDENKPYASIYKHKFYKFGAEGIKMPFAKSIITRDDCMGRSATIPDAAIPDNERSSIYLSTPSPEVTIHWPRVLTPKMIGEWLEGKVREHQISFCITPTNDHGEAFCPRGYAGGYSKAEPFIETLEKN